MELEKVNGFSVIARAFDRNGQSLILAVRRFSPNLVAGKWEFEYVTAWHNRGETFWHAGNYHSGTNGLDRAIEDFHSRVTL
jgi:hypothetical protein